MTLLVLLFVLLLTACDPHYPILITNKSADTTKILVKETIRFHTQKQKAYTTNDGFDVYVLFPNELVRVGSAIAEIDNDIPFKAIKIIQNNDTITANNFKEIKDLFDKKILGGLKKPYNITIK